MFESPDSVPDSATLEFDLCIAGAGAASITLALELCNSGLRVCLLEAGGFKPPKIDNSHPYAGESIGRPYPLLGSRLRYFGGTTNHWGGWCRPLDPIDFRKRSFVPLSGWPLQRVHLDSYYRRAARICEIDPPVFELNELPISLISRIFGGARRRREEEFFHRYDPDFAVKNFRFSPPTRFGQRYRLQLERSDSVTCYLNSTVVEIVKPGKQVTRLRVRADGKKFFVRARAYVLALGAIENARLLLESDHYDQPGLGNESDFVGRCFADHIGKTVGAILTSRQVPYMTYRESGIQLLPHLSFQEEFLLKNKLVNLGIIFSSSLGDEFLTADYGSDRRLFSGWKGSQTKAVLNIIARVEPTPNPESRITLSNQKDANGVRRVCLDWRLNSTELESIDKAMDLIARKVGCNNIGRLKRTFYSGAKSSEEYYSFQYHQLGTTRMSEDSSFGVVNADCRVHSIQNLFIAGASVFPTFGFANPTLTIVALAIRLADHLRTQLKSGLIAKSYSQERFK